MSVRLLAALQGDLSKMMAQELNSARVAVTIGVREATQGLKSELRSQIEGSGLGARLANTWRGEVYPKGRPSLGSAGLVYSRAPVVVAAHDQGALIRSKNGFWLAIPLPAAGTGPRGKRMTPGLWERMRGQRLRFVYRSGKPSLLVADNLRAKTGKRGGFAAASASAQKSGRGLTTVPIFLLVPQAQLKKKFDIASAAQRWQDRLMVLVTQSWPEESSDT